MQFFARTHSFAGHEAPIVIGEIGVNHNGDIGMARRLVDVAVQAGVDVVKFQAFKTEREISRFAALTPYQRQASPQAANQFDLCKALELAGAALRELRDYCLARGIGFLCSAFDCESIDLLVDDMKARALKIASGEVTNLPLLDYVGRKQVGVILSTGGSTLGEIGEAVATLRRAGSPQIALLHCVSAYPAPPDQLNLRAIETLRQQFGLPTGFSDHSQGIEAAIAAVGLGAVAIEKHFTLDRRMTGPDHQASLEPAELRRLVEGVRLAHRALGDGVKRAAPCEMENLKLIRRGLVARGQLRKGSRLTPTMLDVKRPADGIAPRDLDKVIGRELARDHEDDEPITWASLV
jgi:sialic acid synthase SpsE